MTKEGSTVPGGRARNNKNMDYRGSMSAARVVMTGESGMANFMYYGAWELYRSFVTEIIKTDLMEYAPVTLLAAMRPDTEDEQKLFFPNT